MWVEFKADSMAERQVVTARVQDTFSDLVIFIYFFRFIIPVVLYANEGG
jgi:hypothetical protein